MHVPILLALFAALCLAALSLLGMPWYGLAILVLLGLGGGLLLVVP